MLIIVTMTSRSFNTIAPAQMLLRPKIYNSHLVLELLAYSHGTDSYELSLLQVLAYQGGMPVLKLSL